MLTEQINWLKTYIRKLKQFFYYIKLRYTVPVELHIIEMKWYSLTNIRQCTLLNTRITITSKKNEYAHIDNFHKKNN